MGGSLLGSGLRRPTKGIPFLDHGEPLDQRGGETGGGEEEERGDEEERGEEETGGVDEKR
jgi:hypothetical protein